MQTAGVISLTVQYSAPAEIGCVATAFGDTKQGKGGSTSNSIEATPIFDCYAEVIDC